MNIIQFRNQFRKSLSSKFEINEIDFIFKKLLNYFFNFESTIIGLSPRLELSASQEFKLIEALKLINNNCPLQYVIGKSTFMDFEIYVDSNVLIPRPETEELVNYVLESTKNDDTIFDLCTGSGCIALGLKNKNSSLNVTGIDISNDAILIAVKNSEKLNLNINWIVEDLKKIITKDASIDIIVANPPYVHPNEKEIMHARVLNFEPHMAIFTPKNDPTYYYKYCINFAKKSLKVGGKLFFEINPFYAKEIETLLVNSNFNNIDIKLDVYGKKRMLSSQRNG